MPHNCHLPITAPAQDLWVANRWPGACPWCRPTVGKWQQRAEKQATVDALLMPERLRCAQGRTHNSVAAIVTPAGAAPQI